MLKKKIILILLLISLIVNVSVFATDIDTDENTTAGEVVTPPTEENTTRDNTEQEPEKKQEKEEEPKQQEESSSIEKSSTKTSERNNKPSYESQTTNNKTKSENANLKSLILDGTDLAPEFKASITSYTAIVGLDVEDIKVTAEPEDSEATVSVKGNKGLEEGENTITVIVEAEAGNTKTYTIKVTKTLNEEAMNARIKSLIVQGFNIYPSFQSNIYNYNLNISEEILKLDISVETENEKATFVIEGNEDLKQGDNLVKIIVTAEDGVTIGEYKINVFINSNVVKPQVENKMPALILLAILTVTAIIISGVLIKKHKN